MSIRSWFSRKKKTPAVATIPAWAKGMTTAQLVDKLQEEQAKVANFHQNIQRAGALAIQKDKDKRAATPVPTTVPTTPAPATPAPAPTPPVTQTAAPEYFPQQRVEAANVKAAKRRDLETERLTKAKTEWDALPEDQQAAYRTKIKARRQQRALQYRQGAYDRSGGRFGVNYRPEPEKPKTYKTPEAREAGIAEREINLKEQIQKARVAAIEQARQDTLKEAEATKTEEQAEDIRLGRSRVSAQVMEAVTLKVSGLQRAARSSDLGDSMPYIAQQVFDLLISAANPAGRKLLKQDYDRARREKTLPEFVTQADPERYVYGEEIVTTGGKDALGQTAKDWSEEATTLLNGDPNDTDTAIWGDYEDDVQLAKRLIERWRIFRETGQAAGADDEVIRRAWGVALLRQKNGRHLKLLWEAARTKEATTTDRVPDKPPPSTQQQAMVAAIAQAQQEGVRGKEATIARAREIMAEQGGQ